MLGIFGKIEDPIPSAYSGGLVGGGLETLVSNIIAFLAIVGGLIVFINFIIAGYMYLSAEGKPQSLLNAGNKIIGSLIGMVVIAAAFVIASVIGLVFFNDAGFLLRPQFFKVF